MDTTRALIRRGFPVGPSSGLNYAAAVRASQTLDPGANVVTVFPDRMERYHSTELIQRPCPEETAPNVSKLLLVPPSTSKTRRTLCNVESQPQIDDTAGQLQH